MKHELMKLPYSYGALAPILSKETLTYHHDKHHKTYVNKLNELIVGTDYEHMSLEKIITNSQGAIFNNASQVYNHDFYFKCMTPLNTKISISFERAIIQEFGLFEDFKNEFIQKGASFFGSGWVWLVVDDMGKLKVLTTSNAQTPLYKGITPLLVCDLWEHAYYIDFRNSKLTYLEKWWSLVNWDFVSRNYERVSVLFKPSYVDKCNENSAECNYTHEFIHEKTVSF